jgi:hypothetical protein
VNDRSLDEWAREICERQGIRPREELRRTTHDLSDRLRNLVWEVEHAGRAAVLKVYDDDVVNVEAESLRAFHESNRSPLMGAPELYMFETTSTREQQRAFAGAPAVLEHDALLPRLEAAMDRVRSVFKGRELHWGHGHFKPSDLFRYADGRWALTDFGHTKMLPEGYEEALAVWWDQMIAGAVRDYRAWRDAIDDWTQRFLEAEPELDRKVLTTSLVERALATVLESIALDDDMPPEECGARLELHYRLIDELT